MKNDSLPIIHHKHNIKIDRVILRKLTPDEIRGVVYRRLKALYGREPYISRLVITDEEGTTRTYHLN